MKTNAAGLIGIVGLPGAGKTTAADYLVRSKGFKKITLSDFIRRYLKDQGIAVDSRLVLQIYGNRLRKKNGADVLVRWAESEMKKKKYKKVVIEGVRNLFEVKYIQNMKDGLLLGIKSPIKARFDRLHKSKGKDYVRSYAKFLEEEKNENKLGSKKIGFRVNECLDLCNVVIRNSKGKKELYKKIDAILEGFSTK